MLRALILSLCSYSQLHVSVAERRFHGYSRSRMALEKQGTGNEADPFLAKLMASRIMQSKDSKPDKRQNWFGMLAAQISRAESSKPEQEPNWFSTLLGSQKGSTTCRRLILPGQRAKFECKCAPGFLPMLCEGNQGSESCKLDGDRCGMSGKFYREELSGSGCNCRTPPLDSKQVQVQFDEKMARSYLEYARASFCTKYSIENWSCGDACDSVKVVPGKVRHIVGQRKKGTAYVAQVPSTNVIRCVTAFRGSEDIENWLANFQFPRTQWPPWCPRCLVHSGFLETYLEIRDSIFEALQDFQCQHIALAGHSLGGALAQLAAIELRRKPNVPHVGPVWTFGMPRVGNPEFVGAFMWEAKKRSSNPPLWRVVNFKDPVPHLPPTFNDGFRHPPTEVYYQRNSSYIMCASSSTGDENTTCSKSHLLPIGPDHMLYLGKTTVLGDMHPHCRLTGSDWA